MRTINTVKTAERRRQILDAALVCFEKKGFNGATMSSICKAAKMSPGHLYHYFSSKEDLIEAIVEEDRKIADVRIQSIAETSNTLETLVQGVNNMWARKVGIDGALNAEIIAEATRNKRIAAIVIQRNRHITEVLTQTIKIAQKKGHINENLDAEGFAVFLIGVTEGLTALTEADPTIDMNRVTESVRYIWRKTLTPESKDRLLALGTGVHDKP